MAKAKADGDDFDSDKETNYFTCNDNVGSTDNSDSSDDDDDDDEEDDVDDEDNSSDADDHNSEDEDAIHNEEDDEDDDDVVEEEEDDIDPLSSDCDDPDRSQCPVCLMSLNGQQLGTPNNCQHVFCFLCISEWSKNSNTCPVDRKKFDEILIHQTKKGPVIKKVQVEDKQVLNDQEWEQAPTNCEICDQSNREAMMLLCDGCDRGYHMFCLTPRLHEVPEGDWYCDMCLVIRNETIPDVDIPVNQPPADRHSVASISGTQASSARSTRRRTTSTRGRGRGRPRSTTTRRPRSSSTRRKTKQRGKSKSTAKNSKTSKRGRPSSTTSRRKSTKRRTTTRKRKRKTTSKKSPRKKRRKDDDTGNQASFVLPNLSRERLNTTTALSILGDEFALHDFDAKEGETPKAENLTQPKRPQSSSTDVLSSILDEIEVLHDDDARVSRDGSVISGESRDFKSPKASAEKTAYSASSQCASNLETSSLKRPCSALSTKFERVKVKKFSLFDISDEVAENSPQSPENVSKAESNSKMKSDKCAAVRNFKIQENTSNMRNNGLSGSKKCNREKISQIGSTRIEQNVHHSAGERSETASLCLLNLQKNSERTDPTIMDECSGKTATQPLQTSFHRLNETLKESSTRNIIDFQDLTTKFSKSPSMSKRDEKSRERKLQKNNEFKDSTSAKFFQFSSMSGPIPPKTCERPPVRFDDKFDVRLKDSSAYRKRTSELQAKRVRSDGYQEPFKSSKKSHTASSYKSNMTSQLNDLKNTAPVSRDNLTSAVTSSNLRMMSHRDDKDVSHVDVKKKPTLSTRFSNLDSSSPVIKTTNQTLSSRFTDYTSTPSVTMTAMTSKNSRHIDFKGNSNELRVNVNQPERQKITIHPSLGSNLTHPSLPKLKLRNAAQSNPPRPKLKGLVSKHEGKHYPSLNTSYAPCKTTDSNYQQKLAIIDMLRSKKSSLKAEIKRRESSDQSKNLSSSLAVDNQLAALSCSEISSPKISVKREQYDSSSKPESLKSSGYLTDIKTLPRRKYQPNGSDTSLTQAERQLWSSQKCFESGRSSYYAADSKLSTKAQEELYSSQPSGSGLHNINAENAFLQRKDPMHSKLLTPKSSALSAYAEPTLQPTTYGFQEFELRREVFNSPLKLNEKAPDSYSSLPTRSDNFHRPKLHSLMNNTSQPSSLPVAIVRPSRTVDNEEAIVKHDGNTNSLTTAAPLLHAVHSSSISAADTERLENRKKGIARLQRLASIKDSVRLALQTYYDHKEITKGEFKDIFIKAVQKVHQSSAPIDFIRISELVKKYVKKYKGLRC